MFHIVDQITKLFFGKIRPFRSYDNFDVRNQIQTVCRNDISDIKAPSNDDASINSR